MLTLFIEKYCSRFNTCQSNTWEEENRPVNRPEGDPFVSVYLRVHYEAIALRLFAARVSL